MSSSSRRIPVLLLKTRSTPDDSYEEYFSHDPFTPIFIPVLEHRPNRPNLDFVRSLLLDGKLGRDHNAQYGGMIFTSQRAVEGFASVVDDIEAQRSSNQDSNTQQTDNPYHLTASSTSTPLPFYVVGPATSRTLTSLLSSSPSSGLITRLNPQIFGSHTGNGEALAHYILQHYHTLSSPSHPLPLLFLVGEQRRDIIPKTLMDPTLPASECIRVDELVVYETGVMESFADHFCSHINHIESRSPKDLAVPTPIVAIVIFSPSGSETALRHLNYIDNHQTLIARGKDRNNNKTNKVSDDNKTKYIVATIGPTTRDYLRREFGFEADICAETPSPEGVGEGIKKFLAKESNPTSLGT